MYTRLIPFHQAPSQNFPSFLKMVLQTFQDYVLVEEKKKCSYFSHIKENALSEFFTHVFIQIGHWVWIIFGYYMEHLDIQIVYSIIFTQYQIRKPKKNKNRLLLLATVILYCEFF